jgi:hypothetical protein
MCFPERIGLPPLRGEVGFFVKQKRSEGLSEHPNLDLVNANLCVASANLAPPDEHFSIQTYA